MSHTRPHGLGWGEGQTATPVEVMADPPGDGIGPDHTAPDAIDGQDPREVRRLQRDHRALLKDSEGDRPDLTPEEPNDTQHDEAQRAPFKSAAQFVDTVRENRNDA